MCVCGCGGSAHTLFFNTTAEEEKRGPDVKKKPLFLKYTAILSKPIKRSRKPYQEVKGPEEEQPAKRT